MSSPSVSGELGAFGEGSSTTHHEPSSSTGSPTSQQGDCAIQRSTVVEEDGERLVLRINTAGARKEDVRVQVLFPRKLLITVSPAASCSPRVASSSPSSDLQNASPRERGIEPIDLPDDVDINDITAQIHDDSLTVEVPVSRDRLAGTVRSISKEQLGKFSMMAQLQTLQKQLERKQRKVARLQHKMQSISEKIDVAEGPVAPARDAGNGEEQREAKESDKESVRSVSRDALCNATELVQLHEQREQLSRKRKREDERYRTLQQEYEQTQRSLQAVPLVEVPVSTKGAA
jgi:HSP20 family molecular chaperone IbpA